MSRQLDLIEAYLRGEARVKVWDCNRNSTHKQVPPVAFFLWHYFWTREDHEQESYLSMATIMEETGLAKNTVIKWRRWLLENGWLRQPGGTAADKYESATPGADKVMVLRVDDPTKGGKLIHIPGGSKGEPPVQAVGGSKVEPNVYVYGSGSPYGSDSSCSCSSSSPSISTVGTDTIPPSGKTLPPTAEENQKPRTKGKTKTKSAPDGTPYPEEFNLWSNLDRLTWLQNHSGQSKPSLPPAQTKLTLDSDSDGEPCPICDGVDCSSPPSESKPAPECKLEPMRPDTEVIRAMAEILATPEPPPKLSTKSLGKCEICGWEIRPGGCDCDEPLDQNPEQEHVLEPEDQNHRAQNPAPMSTRVRPREPRVLPLTTRSIGRGSMECACATAVTIG